MGGSGKDMDFAEQHPLTLLMEMDATDDSPKYVWNQELEACTVKAVHRP
jgi:hypothetical protein